MSMRRAVVRRRAVVSYPVDASAVEMQRACLDGIGECAAEALTHGAEADRVCAELERVMGDAECGDLV